MSNPTTSVFGMTLFSGTAGATAATAVAGILAIGGLPTLTFDEYENTWVNQASIMKSFIMTFADGGSLQVTLAMLGDTLTTAYALADRVDRSWKIVIPTPDGPATLEFEGPVKEVKPEAGDAKAEAKVTLTIRCTDIPVYTEAA